MKSVALFVIAAILMHAILRKPAEEKQILPEKPAEKVLPANPIEDSDMNWIFR